MPGQRNSHPEPSTILFAGGCHVLGFPVGEENSFPTLVQRQLSSDGVCSRVELLPYLLIRQHGRLIEKCRETRPDVLVLQLGHFELSRRISIHVRSMCGLSGTSPNSKDSMIQAAVGDSIALFHLKSRIKWAVDCCLGHPLVDFQSLETLWEQLFERLSECHVPTIVLMSPLPCADPTAMYYRKRALPLFERMARQHRAEFVDLLSTPRKPQRHYGADYLYYDAVHLGIPGQHAAAAVLAPRLRSILEGLPAPSKVLR